VAEKESKKSTGRGGRRPGAGRKKGRVSEKKREIQEMCREHADAALKALLKVATKGRSEGARVMAIRTLFEFGFGKPRQAVEVTGGGGGPVHVKVTHHVVDPSAR
jgi:hypothetical protein